MKHKSIIALSSLFLLACGKLDKLAAQDNGSLKKGEGLDVGAKNAKLQDRPEFRIDFADFDGEKPRELLDPKLTLFSKLSVDGLSKKTFEDTRADVVNFVSVFGPKGWQRKYEKRGVDLNWNIDLPEEGFYRLEVEGKHVKTDFFKFVKSKFKTVLFDKSAPVVNVEGKVATNMEQGKVTAEFKISAADFSETTCDGLEVFDVTKNVALWKRAEPLLLSTGEKGEKDKPESNSIKMIQSELIVARDLPVASAWSLGLRGSCQDRSGNSVLIGFQFQRDSYEHLLQGGTPLRKGLDPEGSGKAVSFSKTGSVPIDLKLVSAKTLEALHEDLVTRDGGLWKVAVSAVPYSPKPDFFEQRNTVVYGFSKTIAYEAPAGWLGYKELYVTLLRTDENGANRFVNSASLPFYFDNKAPSFEILSPDQFLTPQASLSVSLQFKSTSVGAPLDLSSIKVQESIDNSAWKDSPVAVSALEADRYELKLTSNYTMEVPLRYRVSFADLAGNGTSFLSRNILGAADLLRSVTPATRSACGSAKSLLSVQFASSYYCESSDPAGAAGVHVWFFNKGLAPMKFGNGLGGAKNDFDFRLSDSAGGSRDWFRFSRSHFESAQFVESPVVLPLDFSKAHLTNAGATYFEFDVTDNVENLAYKSATLAGSTCYAGSAKPQLKLKNASGAFEHGLKKSPFPCQ